MRKFLFILASTTTFATVDLAGAQYLPPGGVAPGYNWREDRAQDDWRNNTWREERAKEDWRYNTWQEKRAREDWRYNGPNGNAEDGTTNNATNTAVTSTVVTAECQRLAASRGIPRTNVPHSLWDSFMEQCQAGQIK